MQVKLTDVSSGTAETRRDINAAIKRVLESDRHIFGPELESFEHEFAREVGAKEAIGLASQPDALWLLLSCLGISPRSEIIMSGGAYTGTAMAVIRAGFTPKLSDVNPLSGLVTLQEIKDVWRPDTKAVVQSHLYGHLAPVNDLLKWRIPIIQDAGHATGLSDEHGTLIGAYPANAVWNFFPSMNIGGLTGSGAITTNDQSLAAELRIRRDLGQRGKHRHELPGWTSVMSEIEAAVLRAKLPKLRKWNKKRAHIAERYIENLRNITPITLPAARQSVWNLFPVLVDKRDRILMRLSQDGVETGIHYPFTLNKHTIFADAFSGVNLPNAESRAERLLSLPIHPYMTDNDVDIVCARLRKAIRRV